jgi:thiosulfate dehydrogenase
VRLFLLGLIIGTLIPPIGIYVYFASGRAPVSAFDPQLPFEDIVTGQALRATSSRQPAQPSPIAADEANLRAGARLYVRQCAVCHGLPIGPVSRIATGMFPPPPQLFHGPGVTDDPVGETYWKTAHGIRLTGMPAFRGSLSDTEMWQISSLLANAKHLPASVVKELDTASTSSTPVPLPR